MDKNVNTTGRVSAQPDCHQLLSGLSVAMGRMSRKSHNRWGHPAIAESYLINCRVFLTLKNSSLPRPGGLRNVHLNLIARDK